MLAACTPCSALRRLRAITVLHGGNKEHNLARHDERSGKGFPCVSIYALFLASDHRACECSCFCLLYLTPRESNVMVGGRWVQTPGVGCITTLDGRDYTWSRQVPMT